MGAISTGSLLRAIACVVYVRKTTTNNQLLLPQTVICDPSNLNNEQCAQATVTSNPVPFQHKLTKIARDAFNFS